MTNSGWIWVVITGLALAVLAAGLIFPITYAITLGWITHSWSMVQTVLLQGDFLAPWQQARAYWGHPTVTKVLDIAVWITVVGAGLLGLCGAALTYYVRRNLKPAGATRLGTLSDLKKAGLLNGVPGHSVLLGTFRGRDVRYSGDSHFFVNGPSRAGKGRGFVMPNLLEWAGSVIVLDVKLENWNKTGPARTAMGQKLFLFAPGSEQSHRWNPLDFVRPWPARATDLQNLAAALLPPPPRGETFWAETAQSILASLMAYVLESPTMDGRRTMRSVLRMFAGGLSLSDRMKLILETESGLPPFIRDNFEQHLIRDDKQKASFESNITTNLRAWNNSLLADVTSASDFDIRDLRRTRMSIYIGAPVSDFATVEPLIRLFIQQVHDVLLRNEPGKDEPHKLLLMLDEFYQFGRLPEIVLRAPLVAGYGFRIALIAQNLPQIDEKYSKVTREALVGNMDVKLFVAVGDDTTADVVSRDFGRTFIKRHSSSEGQGRRNTQSRWEQVPLMAPDEVKRLDDRKTLLHIRGHYGAMLDKLNFYTDRRFKKVLDAAAPYASFLKVPLVPGNEEWPLNEIRVVAKPAKPAPEDRRNDDAWSDVVKYATTAFRAPALFIEQVKVAGHDPDLMQALAQELAEEPSTLAELRGRMKIGMPDAERKAALIAVGGLRRALLRLRIIMAAGRADQRSPAAGADGRGSVRSTVPNPAPAQADSPGDEVTEIVPEVAVVAIAESLATDATATATAVAPDLDTIVEETASIVTAIGDIASNVKGEQRRKALRMQKLLEKKVAVFTDDTVSEDMIPYSNVDKRPSPADPWQRKEVQSP